MSEAPRRRTPTPATVISLVALFVALTGTAWAAATIGSGDIQDDAVKSRHIAPAAVATSDLATGAVSTARLADESVSSGKLRAAAVTGPKIADGAVSTGKLGPIPAARVDKPLEFGVFVPNNSEVLFDPGQDPTFATYPNMYDNNTSLFTAPRPGIYQVTGALAWAPNGTGTRRLSIKRNGSDVVAQTETAANGSSNTVQEATGLVQLDTGDTIGMYAFQTSGDTLSYERDSRTHLDMTWVAPAP